MQKKTAPARCRGGHSIDGPWLEGYLPFFAGAFAAGLAADLVVFFEIGFLGDAMGDSFLRVKG